MIIMIITLLLCYLGGYCWCMALILHRMRKTIMKKTSEMIDENNPENHNEIMMRLEMVSEFMDILKPPFLRS